MRKYLGAILFGHWAVALAIAAGDTLRIDAVFPSSGATTPGITVTVQGDGFAPGAKAYFDGLMARQSVFVDPIRLEVVTPYLRPGLHSVYVKSGEATVRSAGAFAALPTNIDSKIDAAFTQAEIGQVSAALRLLEEALTTTDDNQVRAFVHYQRGQLYYAEGDWRRWHVETALIYDTAAPAGMTVQTYWPYGLAFAQTIYYLLMQKPHDSFFTDDFVVFDSTVQLDVTQNPEPRFFRGLLYARAGNVSKGKADSEFLLQANRKNASYAAFAAFVSAVAGDRARASHFSAVGRELMATQERVDVRTLSLLGDAAYISGDLARAQEDWAQAGRQYPVGADIAFMAGKKHLLRGEQRIAAMFLSECLAMAPGTKMANKAQDLLVGIPSSH